MSYTPTRRGNACIHCGDVTGKCRVHRTREMHLCVSLAGSRKGETSQGYVVIGDTDDGRWSQLLPDNGSEYSSEKIIELRLNWKRLEEQAKRERLAGEMPAVERDKYYREILDQLSLTPEDKADLLRRGFTEEQIIKSGFKSVERWQKLDKTYPGNLPGINKHGNGLISHTPGYACPIKNADGLIVGLQVRKRVLLSGDTQRYYFLSTNSNIRLGDQVPLAVFIPETRERSYIGLAEGVGAKPFLTCERLEIPVIAASGGSWASSPDHLKAALTVLGVKPEDEVVLFADAGSVSNKPVIHQYIRTANLLKSWGHVVTFGWWGQVDKSFRDIDELQPEEYPNISYLSVSEFKTLCIKWGGLEKEQKLVEPTPISYADRVAEAQRKLHTLSYPSDFNCDPSKKYLPNLVGRIPTKGIVAIKSPKGSGKSHQIKLIKEYCCGYWEEITTEPSAPNLPPEQLSLLGKNKSVDTINDAIKPETKRIRHKGLGMNFLSINARIALGREQAIRWDFTWIEDADLEGLQEFGGEKIATQSIIENIGEIGLCWDSLSKIFNRDWSNTLVVIDEIELGLNHVSTSSTCRDRRSFILHTLEQKLRECLDNDGLVLVADADLSDVSLDYLTSIAPGHPPFIVSHDYKGSPWEIDFYTGSRDIILSQIEEWVSDEDCEPIAVAIDNQKEAESLASILTRKYPWLSKEVGGLIRIDSRITQTDYGKDFVKRPNESIEKYQPKILIYTPSLGVGCSIDIKYFAHVFGLFFGNLEPSQARQMLARVRESVPRTVWAKDRGTTNSENEPNSYLPEEIKRRLFDYHDTTTALIQLAINLAKEKTENPESDKDILPNLIEVLEGMMDKKSGTWNNPHLDLYCDQVARRNFSLNQFAIQLREELISEGHQIRDDVGDGKTTVGEAVRGDKEEIKRRDANLTANAKNITLEEAQEIKRKPARTTEEEHAASKAFLQRELPEVELTPDFLYKAVYKDNRQWLNQAKLYWWCLNPDAIKHDDSKEWKAKLKQFSKGVPFLPDIKTYTPKVDAILKSGVLEWIDPNNLEAEYCNESPSARQFLQRTLAIRRLLKTALGITVTHNSEPIALANRILDRVGLGLTFHRRDESREGNRTRYYKLNEELATDSDRLAVWNAQNIRWQNELNQIAETKAQQKSQRPQNLDNFLYKNKSSGGNNKPEDNTPNGVVEHTTDEWKQPNIISDIADALNACENSEMLAMLRECNIPREVFKNASNMLSPQKREQIRQWVIEQNSA